MHQKEAELIARVLQAIRPDLDIRAEKVPGEKPARWQVVTPDVTIEFACQYADIRIQALAADVQRGFNEMANAFEAAKGAKTDPRARALAAILLPGQ